MTPILAAAIISFVPAHCKDLGRDPCMKFNAIEACYSQFIRDQAAGYYVGWPAEASFGACRVAYAPQSKLDKCLHKVYIAHPDLGGALRGEARCTKRYPG